MILADENIPFSIIQNLRKQDIDVYSIYENARGISDKAVITLAQDPPRIILTEDKDFGEWVFAHGIKSISVVFLRYKFPEQEQISKILISILAEGSNDLFGHFITITLQKIRYRKI